MITPKKIKKRYGVIFFVNGVKRDLTKYFEKIELCYGRSLSKCPVCRGRRRILLFIKCPHCNGHGWLDQDLRDIAADIKFV